MTKKVCQCSHIDCCVTATVTTQHQRLLQRSDLILIVNRCAHRDDYRRYAVHAQGTGYTIYERNEK